jgi:subtilase family serine protease
VVRGYLTPPPDCGAGENIIMVVIENSGAGLAGPFQVQLLIDDAVAGDPQDLSGLGPVQSGRVIFNGVVLSEGPHTLTANADSAGQVTETDEASNSFSRPVTCATP